MSRFNKINAFFDRDRKYRKPVNKGSFVYIYDTNIKYEAKTVYKVHYADLAKERILVEVDPKKNFIDSKFIKGWTYYSRTSMEVEHYELKKDKLYWWVYLWQQASNSYVLNNE